jgi:hypothetical protein
MFDRFLDDARARRNAALASFCRRGTIFVPAQQRPT